MSAERPDPKTTNGIKKARRWTTEHRFLAGRDSEVVRIATGRPNPIGILSTALSAGV
jgi:hypothetical protein